MRLSYRILALTFALSTMGANLALANTNSEAKIMFHLSPKVAKVNCGTGRISTCTNAVTQGTLIVDANGPFYYCFIIAAWYETGLGIAGAQFGINYNSIASTGVDVFSWTLCGALEFPSDDGVPVGSIAWPKAGSGNLMTWDASTTDPNTGCQHDSVAVCGYLYMGAYQADTISIIARPIDGKVKIAACSNNETILTDPNALGTVAFSAGATVKGKNPCMPVPTRPVTWGLLKGMYRQ